VSGRDIASLCEPIWRSTPDRLAPFCQRAFTYFADLAEKPSLTLAAALKQFGRPM
jgi:hypothetical protein